MYVTNIKFEKKIATSVENSAAFENAISLQ